jgi:hypothetical protein
MQKLDEVGQLTHRRRCTFRLPTHLNLARHRLHASTRQKHFFVLLQLPFRLTHLVTSIIDQKTTDCLRFSRFARWQLRFLG